MGEWRLFDEGTIPEYTTAQWYAGRDNAPHLEEAFHRPRLIRSARLATHTAYANDLTTVVDLGAGDGGLLSLLGPRLTGWGYDLAPAAVEAAKLRGVDVRLADALSDSIEWGQIAVATEMLEHQVDPHALVARIGQDCRAVVASSPFVERPGNHYEFHTWAWDLAGYAAMFTTAGWRVARHECVGPFQVLLAVRP